MSFLTGFPDSVLVEQKLLASLIDRRARRILELGCGDGRTFNYYSEAISQVIGLDTDWTELRLARQQWRTVPLIHGDAVTLPFAAASFDLIVWSWAF